MFSQDDEGQQGLVLAVVLGLIAFVVTLVIGISLDRLHRGQPPAPPALLVTATGTAVAAPAPAPIASAPLPAAAEAPANLLSTRQAATDAATVMVEQGVVRFYFASGKADLAAGAGDALGDVVKAAKAGRTLVISGFHDATGDAAKNAALAKQRAVAVKDALKAAGVPERQIELKKPEQLAAGAGSNAEARRVEITLQ